MKEKNLSVPACDSADDQGLMRHGGGPVAPCGISPNDRITFNSLDADHRLEDKTRISAHLTPEL